MSLRIINADCRNGLSAIPEKSVQCVVTSPPYWGLRAYLDKDDPNKALEIGQEKTPQEYVDSIRQVARGIWRVLKDDGTFWLNLGDCYAASDLNFLKPKDLVGIPWRVALALQSDGWYLRSDIIWAKPNCMPESVADRPTRSHEYIFLLTKSPKYFYDADAIKEPCIYDVDGTGTAARKARQIADNKSNPTSERAGIRAGGVKDAAKMNGKHSEKQRGHSRRRSGFNDRWDDMGREEQCQGMRNKRDVWTVSPAQYRDSHFATFPPELIRPCILAGSRIGDTVLDPFGGSGTTAQVAMEINRNAILIELNKKYIHLIKKRTAIISPELKLR